MEANKSTGVDSFIAPLTPPNLGTSSFLFFPQKELLKFNARSSIKKPVKAAWGVGVKKYEHQFSVKMQPAKLLAVFLKKLTSVPQS